MNILQLSGSPVAGVPWRLSEIINNYTPHTSKTLIGYHVYKDGRTYGQPDASLGDYRRAIELVAWADTIVLHNGGRHHHVKRLNLRGKKAIAYYHSEPQHLDRSWEKRGVPAYVIAQGHALLYPGMPVLPNMVDLDDPRLQPLARDLDGEIILGWAPSTRVDNPEFCKTFPFSSKGWNRTRPVLDRIFKDGVADVRIFERMPWAECMKARMPCHIMLDEVVTGSYHRSTLEAGCQGQLVINALDERVRQIIVKLTGAVDVPWLRASPETLYDELRTIVSDRRGLGERMAASRAWMEAHWSPQTLLARHWLPALEKAPMIR